MSLKQFRILLADDDTDDCQFFRKAIEELLISATITTVPDGEKLMSYLYKNAKHLPDILFLDLNMPRKNGFECLIEIKEDIRLMNLPVIMLSTSFPRDREYEEDMINRLLKIGARDFIRKSGDLSQLKQAIHKAITDVTDNKSHTHEYQTT